MKKKWIKLLKDYKGHKSGEQIEIAEEVADVLIEAKSAEVCEDPTKDAITEAQKQFKAAMKEIAEDAATTVITKLTENVGEKNADGTPKKKDGKRPAIVITHDNELDDPMLGFKNTAEFYYTLVSAQGAKNGMSQADAHKKIFGDGGYIPKLKATGHAEAIDSEGGIFVTPEINNEILTVSAQFASVASHARGFNMGGMTYQIRARVDKNHATSVSGGIVVNRKPEGVAPDKSKGQWEWVTFKATKITGYTALTDEVMADAPAFASLFPGMFAEQINFTEDGEFTIDGDGAGMPLGAFHANNPSLIVVSKEAAQVAATLNLTNVLKMRSRCYGYQTAVWVANQDIIPALASFTIGTVPVFLPSAKEDVADTLLGRPVIWSEHASTLGTQNDLMLGNYQEYGIANRSGFQSASSMHVKFLEGEQVLKFWKRDDGQPLWRSALTPRKGNTRSPFVTLETRA